MVTGGVNCDRDLRVDLFVEVIGGRRFSISSLWWRSSSSHLRCSGPTRGLPLHLPSSMGFKLQARKPRLVALAAFSTEGDEQQEERELKEAADEAERLKACRVGRE